MARPTAYPVKKVIGFDQVTLDAVEAFRREQTPIPNQSEAIRLILTNWLQSNGYLPSDQEGTRPEDLNASNDG